MPIFFPPRMVRKLAAEFRWFVAWALLVFGAAVAPAQVLARPGWNDNWLDTSPWWQHAVFYEIDGGAGAAVESVAHRLDGLRSLGVDALLLPAPEIPTQAGGDDAAVNALDELTHEASLRGMRVLLTMPEDARDPAAEARFWMTRGIAGFRVADAGAAETVRKVTGAAIGQRIVLSDFDAAGAPASLPRRVAGRRGERVGDGSVAQLAVDSRMGALTTLDAASLRGFLGQTLNVPGVVLDFRPAAAVDAKMARPLGAVLLTLHAAGIINAGAKLPLPVDAAPVMPAEAAPAAPKPVVPPQAAPGTYVPYVPYTPPVRSGTSPAEAVPEMAMDPLTDWYRQLAQLHHGNAVLRGGTTAMLDFDRQNALVWVTHMANSSPLTPPVVVLCNLSGSPVEVALGPALKALNLRGTYLRTLLRSDKAMGPQDLNAVKLPGFAVYVGELRR